MSTENCEETPETVALEAHTNAMEKWVGVTEKGIAQRDEAVAVARKFKARVSELEEAEEELRLLRHA